MRQNNTIDAFLSLEIKYSFKCFDFKTPFVLVNFAFVSVFSIYCVWHLRFSFFKKCSDLFLKSDCISLTQ